jgi:hypothetical protein
MNSQDLVSETELPEWILNRVPAVRETYDDVKGWAVRLEGSQTIIAYAMFNDVLRPHIVNLLERHDDKELQRIFDLLEYLAIRGDLSVKNELRVTMEDMDLWEVWKFLGETMRRNEFESLTWVGDSAIDKARYQERWRQEIEALGGFENLTDENELVIRHRLVGEFDVRGIRAPEPGGEEWKRLGLRWPVGE